MRKEVCAASGQVEYPIRIEQDRAGALFLGNTKVDQSPILAGSHKIETYDKAFS
ncbi:MAG: hypothetical protein AAF546_09210 [Verrucomicrobiota bacterium]